MIQGLCLLLTTGFSIWLIVVDFRTHSRRETGVDDCYTLEKTGQVSSVPLFFGLSAITKISLALLQIAFAIDCFILSDVKLRKETPSFEDRYLCRGFWVFIYFWASFATVVMYFALLSTECFSCCLRHGVIKEYILWTSPALLMGGIFGLAFSGVVIYGAVIASVWFVKLIFRALTFSEDAEQFSLKEQEFVCL